MTRPRSSAPGPRRPGRPRSHPIPGSFLPFVAALGLALAACASSATEATPTDRASAGATAADPTGPAPSDPVDPSSDGLEIESEAPVPASPDASEAPSSDLVATATDCTGTAENRTFYESVAVAVAWTVYCPVLPSGWYVEQGSYRLADGGRLVITYQGPGGAHITLSEGAWCTDGSSCVPPGTDAGSAAYGDREGSLRSVDGSGYVIAVDPGSAVSWQLVGEGLDEATVRAFGAALIAVGG